MFGIGETELVLILLFAFLVFGPDKLPGMGRTLGRALRQFQNAQEGFNKVVQADILDPAADALHEKPKRSEQLKASAASDEDRDSALHPETFAERRARLKEEREAAQKAQEEVAENATAAITQDKIAEPTTQMSTSQTDTSSSTGFSTDVAKTPQQEVTEVSEKESTSVPSAQELYNLGGKRSSHYKKEDIQKVSDDKAAGEGEESQNK